RSFFQAEDGIRDGHVTGVQTCALPISLLTLRKRSVPFSAGRGILATWEPNQTAVLEAIHDLGLDLQVIFNKGAVMVLPSGVNKEIGRASCREGVWMTEVLGSAEE